MKAPMSSVIAIAVCNALSSLAYAQQAPTASNAVSADKKNSETQQVEVKARSEAQLARQDAAAKVVVSNADLIKFGDTNILDAMRKVPGVQVNNNKIQLLGMNAAYTQVLIDGEPPRGVNVEDIPMQMIERIEIYRTANAQFSTQAIGGTVNIILKRTASNAQQSIKFTVGKIHREMGVLEYNKSNKEGNFSYSVAATASLNNVGANAARESDTQASLQDETFILRRYASHTDTRTSNRDFRVVPRIQYKTDSNISLTSTSTFAHSAVEADSDIAFTKVVGIPLEFVSIKNHDTTSRYSMFSTLRATTSLSNDWKLDISGGVHGNRMQNSQRSLNYNAQNQLTLIRHYDTPVRVLGAHTSGKISVPTNEKHDIVVGWSGSGTAVHIDRNQSDTNPVLKESVFTPQNAKNEIYKAALYAQDEWKIQKQSSIYLGLRWESLRIKSQGSDQKDSNYSTGVLSPIVQTVYQLDPQNTERVRVGLARTYQAPNDFYLVSPKIYAVNNSVQAPNFIGNPQLRPELSWGLDLAFEHNGKDGLNYAVRGKVQQVNDLNRDTLYQENGAWWKKYVNAGSARGQNIELSTQFPLKRFINDAPDLDLSLTYMHFWSNVKGLPTPYNQLNPYTYQFTFNANYRLKDVPLSLGINTRMQDSHWQQTSLTEREYIKNPTVVDVYALWKFANKSQLRLALNNLTNSQVTDTYNQLSVPGYVSNTLTSAPRARNISLSYEFKL